MKASKFSDAQKAFILKQGAEGLLKCHRDFRYAGLWLCVAAEHFAADGSLVAISAEQQPFYRRSFNYRIVCEARPYPQTAKRLCLMALHFPSVTNHLYHQYAFFIRARLNGKKYLRVSGFNWTLSRPDIRTGQRFLC